MTFHRSWKAIDSLEWPFVERNLEHFNFGASLVTWFRSFYTDRSRCIQKNGWSSEFSSLSRRVRQGCQLSPYLVILCAEVLANAVRKDENIRGINIANVESKLSQCADNTTMILDGSEFSLSRTLLLLDNFAISSGLKINYEKTEALWIGLCKDRDFSIPSNKPISWARGKVYALGVLFSTSEKKCTKSTLIFVRKLKKMKKIMSS